MAEISYTIDSIISDVKRHLSVIGKRLYSKEGKNMFSDITLSSAEDRQILTQYIVASSQNVEAILKQFIKRSTYTSGSNASVTMEIENTRGDDDFATRVHDLIVSFATLNTVGEYLSMLHPDIAQKYQRDALQRMESLLTYVFYKKEPATASADPLSVNSTITNS